MDANPILGPDGSLTFQDTAHIQRWLETSLAGRALLSQAIQENTPSRDSVLIVCEAPGWLEIHKDGPVDVLAVNKLATSGGEAATLAEEYLELTVPRNFRPLLDKRPEFHLIEKRTPAREAFWTGAAEELAFAREIKGAIKTAGA